MAIKISGTTVIDDSRNITNLGSALTAAQGGTGLSASGTSGNVLTSNGSTWTSAAAPGGAFAYCCTNTITSSNLTNHGSITTASHNFFAGTCAGRSITTGTNNNFFGQCAGFSNTTGTNNTFIGFKAGFCITTSEGNFFAGHCAGFSNTSGLFNNFIGCCAGLRTTTGGCNNFFGYLAGICNTDGLTNNFFGSLAGLYNTTGNSNNFFGFQTGRRNTTGGNNNFFGQQAGACNTTGTHNQAFGLCTGFYMTTGCNNLLFGCMAGSASCQGHACLTTESNRIIMGNAFHNCAQIQIGWTTVSDCRDKCIFGRVPHGRGFLENIHPIEYAFKDRINNCLTDLEGVRRYGFSAQNVLAAEGENPVIVSTDNSDRLQMTNDYWLPILVNAVNELSNEVDILKERIHNLENPTT